MDEVLGDVLEEEEDAEDVEGDDEPGFVLFLDNDISNHIMNYHEQYDTCYHHQR